MKANRFSEAQIVAILKQQHSGQAVVQIAREHGISEATAPAARLLQLEPGRRSGREPTADENVSHRRTGRTEPGP